MRFRPTPPPARPKKLFIIAPAWLVKNRREHAAAVRNMKNLGFEIINPAFRSASLSPREKAAEVNRAVASPETDMALALRGGYGSMKLLPFIDFAAVKRKRVKISGFSDLSALLNPIFERTGVIGFHSPMLWNFSKPSSFTVKSFLNALDGFPEKNIFAGAPVRTFVPGRVVGTIKGGNLVTLTALIGTPWETDTCGAVLFLEDVDEKPHEIDRCLAQLTLSGKFRGIKGLVLGDFRGTKPDEIFKMLSGSLARGVPVVHCPRIGHVTDKITVPIGARAALDTRKKSLKILSL